jgi:quinol monooxygenase YgiN
MGTEPANSGRWPRSSRRSSMSQTALFIRHQAKPGKRDEVRRVWEKYARDYVAGSNGQLSYCYCYDDNDPDAILVFQVAADQASAQDFVKQPWFADYERETAALLAGPSEFRAATPQWIKGAAA